MKYFSIIIFTFLALASHAQEIEVADPITTINYHIIKKGETLNLIAAHFNLGIDELLRANPEVIDPTIIYANRKIILPLSHLAPNTPQEGIVINLAEPRLYFYPPETGAEIQSFPITIGSEEKTTPTGKTKIARKRERPFWIPPKTIREEDPSLPEIVPPGPNNPLGDYAIELDFSKNLKWKRILLHGTNTPWTIGGRFSHGCIRLRGENIKTIFENVEIGTPVRIISQVVKVAEIENKIYVEIHLAQTPDEITDDLGIHQYICRKIKNCTNKIDWQKVDAATLKNDGLPTEVSNKQENY